MIGLFWNTSKKKDNDIITKMIEEYNADFIALAEYTDDVEGLLNSVNKDDAIYKQYLNIGSEDITLIGKMKDVSQAVQHKNYSIHIVNGNMIICCAHMPSRIYEQSQKKRRLIMRQMIGEIEKMEDEKGITESIIIGDLNANPYEEECLSAEYLHGIPIAEITRKEKRQIEGREYKMFYNPTWNLLGDYNNPPGTYYFDGSIPDNPYWHLLDQVLVRPSLNNRFVRDRLRIIDKVADVTLINDKGHPDKNISDHLPIIFEIMEEKKWDT